MSLLVNFNFGEFDAQGEFLFSVAHLLLATFFRSTLCRGRLGCDDRLKTSIFDWEGHCTLRLVGGNSHATVHTSLHIGKGIQDTGLQGQRGTGPFTTVPSLLALPHLLHL